VATAAQYVAPHPELVVAPLDAVFQIGQLFWEREPFKLRMAALATMV
jgi:hypothetical protein